MAPTAAPAPAHHSSPSIRPRSALRFDLSPPISPAALPWRAPNGVDKPLSSPSVGEFILRQYAHHLDPLHTNDQTHAVHEDTSDDVGVVLKETKDDTPAETAQRAFASPPLARSFLLPKPFLTHRKNARSSDIPRQTIMKALASRPMVPGPATAPLGNYNFKAAFTDGDTDPSSTGAASPSLTATLANLQTNATQAWSPAATSYLRSPCYFHQRFDGIVDIQKVLEEISEDDYSHSRLVQTATGVREVSKQLQRRPLKRAVRTIMIVTKARDNSLVYLTRDLAEWLLSTPRYGSDLGVNVYVDAKLRHSKRFNAPGLLSKEPRFQHMLKYWSPDLCWSSPEKFDLVLTLGGDGTVLFTSWLFQRVVPPILSFSLGSLGFLTNFEFDKYKEHLDRVMGDAGMRVNLRMRFTCTVWRCDRSPGAEKGAAEEGEQFEVLNELVIDRGPSAYVSNLELYGDDELLTIVQADGCIFSTPTGSTAYSLSAGGSLIHPSIPAILLTPICPHTLSFRPMVLSDALSLRIAVPIKSRSSAYCSFDGKGRIELQRGDYVTLEASQYPFPTVMSGGNEWVESVQRALRWNVRGAVQKGWEEGQDGNGLEEEKWDIDTDAGPYGGTDSGIGQSEDGDFAAASPMRRQMSLLNM